MMKRLFLVLLVWGNLAICAHAQAVAEATEPFRRANVVWLYTADAPTTVLLALAENLRGRGFELDTVAYELGVVTTKSTIPLGTESWPLIIRLRKISGGVELTGVFATAPVVLARDVTYPSEFWGFEWSPAKKTFRELVATAQSYPNGRVRFSRQKHTTE